MPLLALNSAKNKRMYLLCQLHTKHFVILKVIDPFLVLLWGLVGIRFNIQNKQNVWCWGCHQMMSYFFGDLGLYKVDHFLDNCLKFNISSVSLEAEKGVKNLSFF